MARILIADDHSVVREGLKRILEREPDFTIVGAAKDGDEALQFARERAWDVAVLDYIMPGCSALDLLNEIKRQFPERPVLILSAHPQNVHANRVLRAGGSGYLDKASAGEELVNAVRKVVSGGTYVSPALAETLARELSAHRPKPLHRRLTDREYRVMSLLASGQRVNEISTTLHLSPSTVSTYRARVLRKLQLSTNADLVRYSLNNNLAE